MKKCIFLVIACVLFSISYAQGDKVNATIVFEKSEHDFGTVSESGGVIECEFVFTNTGETPIVITKVSASCGCTAPDWSKEPVAPGKQGFIKVTFNPKGRSGDFTKSLTVFTSGNPDRISVKIKGSIQ